MGFLEQLGKTKFIGQETLISVGLINPGVDKLVAQDLSEKHRLAFENRLRAMLFVLIGNMPEDWLFGARYDVGNLTTQDFANIRQAATKVDQNPRSKGIIGETEQAYEKTYKVALCPPGPAEYDELLDMDLETDPVAERLLARSSEDHPGGIWPFRMLNTLYACHYIPEEEQRCRDLIMTLAAERFFFDIVPLLDSEPQKELMENEIRTKYGIPQDDTRLTPEYVKCLIDHTMTIWEPKIFNYIYRKVGDKSLVEDFTQDVFMKAYANLNCGKSFSGWLYRIAHNRVGDHFRREGRRGPVISLDNDPDEDPDYIEPADTRINIQWEVFRDMDRELLYAAIRRLTDEQALVISFRFLEEFSTAETAELMNKTEGAIKGLQFRAVGSLRELLLQDRRFEK